MLGPPAPPTSRNIYSLAVGGRTAARLGDVCFSIVGHLDGSRVLAQDSEVASLSVERKDSRSRCAKDYRRV